jgi:hypothetical protein
MQKTTWTALFLALILVAGACGDDDADETTLEIIASPGGEPYLSDPGGDGPSPGDVMVGLFDLFADEARQTPIGSGRFTCTWNVVGVMCTNHLSLDGRGQLVIQQSGSPADGPTVTESVIGGTGEFRSARGDAHTDFTRQPEGIVKTVITLTSD